MTSSDENMFLKSVELWVYYCIIKLWTRKCPYLYSQPLGKCCIATTVCALLVISSAQTMYLSGKQSGIYTKSNFLGLLPNCGKDQWDSEITYIALPTHLTIKFHISTEVSVGIPTFEWVCCQKLLGYGSSKPLASLWNSTWFTTLWEGAVRD